MQFTKFDWGEESVALLPFSRSCYSTRDYLFPVWTYFKQPYMSWWSALLHKIILSSYEHFIDRWHQNSFCNYFL